MGKRVRSNWAVSLLLMGLGLATALGLGSARASFIPSDVSGLQAWYDASQGVTTSGGVVQSWADLSGNKHTATLAQGTPVLTTGQINGLPAVQFRSPGWQNGADDFLNISGNFFAKEMYWVWKSPSATFNSYGGVLGAQAGRNSTCLVENGNTTFHGNQSPTAVSRNGTVLTSGSGFNMAPVNQYMLLKVVVNDNDPSAKAYQLGRTDQWSFDMDLAEVVAYNRTLTAQEENNVGFYLATRYGIKTPYAPPPASSTLTWTDGAADNWGSANWNPGPVVWPNNESTKAVVGGVSPLTNATVEADYTAHSLDLSGTGKVTVGSGKTLTLLTGVASTGGTLALTDASTLRTIYPNGEPTGSNVLTNLSVSGKASIEVQTGTLTVANTTMASGLTTTGAGTVALQSVSAAPGSFFDVHKGTLSAQAPNYIGAADLVLSGGTFDVSGLLSVVGGLRGGSMAGQWYGGANPGNLGVSLSPDGMYRENGPGHAQREAHWRAARANGGTGPDNTTLIYTGEVYLSGTTTFIEQNDDNTQLWINGQLLINDGSWNNAIRATYTPPAPGWYSFDVRFSNGGGGYGLFGQQDTGQGDSNWDNAAVQHGFRYAAGAIGDDNALNYAPAVDPGDASLFRVASYGAVNMLTTNISVTGGTTGSRLRVTTDTSAKFGNLTFGPDSDLTVAGAPLTPPVSFAGITTNGNASLGVETLVTLGGYNDQGIPGTMRIYGSKTLSIEGADIGSVVARSTNFQVDLGATLQVAGRDLLGGDPIVTLNGGTFTVKPSPASPMYPNAYMMATDVSVIASSTVKADTTGTVALGNLWLQKPVTLTTSGPGTLAFLDIELRAAGTSTLNATTRTLGGSLLANNLAPTLIQKGGSDLLFYHPGSGLAGTTIQVESGRLGLVGAATVTGANLQMTGGSLVLGSPDGSNQTYANAISSTASGTLTAGASGIGVAKGDIILNSLTPGAGTAVELKTEGSHRLILPNGISAPGSLSISAGNVTIGTPSAQLNVSLASLNIGGGTTTLVTDPIQPPASPGNVALTGALSGGAAGTLVTEGTMGVDAKSGYSFGGEVRVNSGKLTLSLAPPIALPPSLELRLNAAAIKGFTDGQTVTQWLDTSGKNHHTTGINSDPAYSTSGVGGLPTVRFDGDDSFNLGNLGSSFSSAATLFVVSTISNDNGYNLFSTRNNDNWWRWDGNGNSYPGVFRTNRINDYTTNMPMTGSYIFEIQSSGAGWEMFLNGTSRGLAGANHDGGDEYHVGGSEGRNLTGDISEVLVFNTALSTADRQAVGAYLSARYGISSAYTGSSSIGNAFGDLRLASGTKLTLAADPLETATVRSIGGVAGPTVTGPMELSTPGDPTVSNASPLTIDATIKATNFNVTGPGTIVLKQDLTITPAGGTFNVPSNAVLSTDGNLKIDASGAAVLYKGELNIASGKLTLNAPAAIAAPANAYARWGLDASSGTVAADTSGNPIGPRDGTLVNSPVWVPDGGIIGGALRFNDTNTYVAVSRSTNGGIDIDNQSFSLSAWAKLAPGTTGSDYFFGQGISNNPTNNQDLVLHVGRRDANSETLAFYSDDLDYGNAAIVSDTANWHHWVMTFDAPTKTQTIWVDGKSVASRTTNGGAPPNGNNGLFAAGGSTDFWLGQANNGNWFGGLLDEAFVYNRVLTTAEVQSLYSAGLNGGYSAVSFGKLTMAPGTQLEVAGSGLAAFDSITALGGGTPTPFDIKGTMITLRGPVAPGTDIVAKTSGPGTLTIDGGFTMGSNSSYLWETNGGSSDLIAVTGSLDVSADWKLLISPIGIVPGGTYNAFTYGTVTKGPSWPSKVKLERGEGNLYADLFDLTASSVSDTGSAIAVTLARYPWVEWNGTGTEWDKSGRWTPPGPPDASIVALVNNPATTATVTKDMGPQAAHTLFIDNGSVLVEAKGDLTVVHNTDVTTAGSLEVQGKLSAAQLNTQGTTTFGPAADPNIPLIHVMDGKTTGQMTPGEMTTLGSGTTLKVSGGTLAGGFSSTNTSKTAGSYAFEVEGGTVNAHLYASTASLRRSGSGAAALNGALTLDTMSIESGSTTLGDAPDLIVNTLTMTGGSLAINRYSQIGKLALTAGTLIPSYRTINVSEAFSGSGTVSVNQNAAINAAKASVNFGGTLEVNNGILFVTVPSGAVTPPELLSGLIGYWPFNEGAGTTANDLSGKNNNGAVNNATWVAGKSGSALSFNGTNSSVNTTVSLFNGLMPNFTVAGWVKPNAGGGRLGLFGQNDLVEAGIDGGNNFAIWANGSAQINTAFPFTVPAADWHHVAFVGSASGLQTYVDGTLRNSGGGAPSGTSGFLFKMGGDGIWDGTGNWYNGLIDDVAAWSRALPAADIQTLVNLGFGGGAYLGNLKLAPGTEARISGGSAGFASVVATGGPSLLNPLTIAPGSIKGSNPTLTFSSAVESSNFSITGTGTVLLQDKLTVTPGGTLSVPAGTTLASQGSNVIIEVASASLAMAQGKLDVRSGKLTVNMPTAAAAGPATYYDFEGVVGTTVPNLGSLGAPKNAVLTNGAGLTGPGGGKSGVGMTIGDGTNQYLNVASGIPLGTEWTISTWYKDLHDDNNWRTLTRSGGGASGDDHQIMVENNATRRLALYDNTRGGGFMAASPTTTLTPYDGWHHIAAVGKANDTTDYYVDGVYKGTVNRRSYGAVNWIGNDGAGWGQSFANVLDDFVIYNRSLSPGEISRLRMLGPSAPPLPPYLGNLTMAPSTELILGGGGAATFTSINAGDGAKITGNAVVDGILNPTGTLEVTGDLTLTNGSIYQWSIGYDKNDLVKSDELYFDKSFTLSLFGAGGTILPGDGPIPIFKYSSATGLFIGGLLYNPNTNPLQYLIDVGNLTDPFNQYVWDASEARLEVLTADPGIYLVGLKARVVPEPTTLTLLALGGLGLLSRRRRRARQSR